MSGRCKACNSVLLDSEGKWDYELKSHDEQCRPCVKAAQQYEDRIPERENIPTGDILTDSGALE